GASRSSGRTSGSPASGRRRCRWACWTASGRAWMPGPGLRGGPGLRRARRWPGRPPRRAPRSWPGTPGGGCCARRRPSRGDHLLAVVDAVLGPIDVDRVVPGAAVNLVELAVACVDHVIARRALLDPVNHVDLIGAISAENAIRSWAARDHVLAGPAAELVLPLAAHEGVIAS